MNNDDFAEATAISLRDIQRSMQNGDSLDDYQGTVLTPMTRSLVRRLEADEVVRLVLFDFAAWLISSMPAQGQDSCDKQSWYARYEKFFFAAATEACQKRERPAWKEKQGKNKKLFAEWMRENPTSHESAALQLLSCFDPYFQRVISGYIADFLVLSTDARRQLVVEINGGQHYTESGRKRDLQRALHICRREKETRVLFVKNETIESPFGCAMLFAFLCHWDCGAIFFANELCGDLEYLKVGQLGVFEKELSANEEIVVGVLSIEDLK